MDSLILGVGEYGRLDDYKDLRGAFVHAIVATGNNELRVAWTKKLSDCGYVVPSIVSDRAYVSPSAIVEEGCVIEPTAVVHTGARVGKASLVSAGAIINHDATVGTGCHVDCGAHPRFA